MARFSGPIMQIAYVVPDLEAAMAHWSDVMGVGPFSVADGVPYERVEYRGKVIELVNRVAIAYSGDMQIELIQQLSPEPSIFTEFATRGGGPHHLCVLCEDFAADLALLAGEGAEVIQAGRTKAGIDFAYLDTTAGPLGAVLELVQGTPGLKRYFERLKQRAAGQDGASAVSVS